MTDMSWRWSRAGLMLAAILAGAGVGTLAVAGERGSRTQGSTEEVQRVATPVGLSPAESAYVHAQADFGARLFRTVAAGQRDKNVFLSPAGAFFALGMAYSGAAADTRQAIGRTLGVGAAAPEALGRSIESTLRELTSDSAT